MADTVLIITIKTVIAMALALETNLVNFDSLDDTTDRQRANELLPQVGRLLALTGQNCSEEQLEIYDDVLMRLSDMVEVQTRMCLAEMMAPLERAPRAIVRQLAQDDICVAAPILLESKILDDIDLAYVVHTQSESHQEAIAKRNELSETLTDLLVEKGSDPVLTVLAGNQGASFSDEGFNGLIERSEAVEEIQLKLVDRSDLPPSLIARFTNIAGERVREILREQGRTEDLEKVDQAKKLAGERIKGDVGQIKKELASAIKSVSALHKKGQIDSAKVLDFAMRDAFPEVVCGCSILFRARLDSTYQVMTQPNPGAFLVLARSVDLPKDLVSKILESGPWRQLLTRDVRAKAIEGYTGLTVGRASQLRVRLNIK